MYLLGLTPAHTLTGAKNLLHTSLVHLGLVPEPKGIIGMRKSIWAGIGQRLAFPSVTGAVSLSK